MKRNQLLTLFLLGILALVAATVFHFLPANQSGNLNAQPSTKAVSEGIDTPLDTAVPTHLSQLDLSVQNPATSSTSNNAQILTPKLQAFVNKIEGILKGAQSRESKILSLMDVLKSAESDKEKIATLQSLASLKPIEYVDELIILSESDKESDEVRAEALNTLNQAYLVPDEDVEKIGGPTIYNQMEKVNQYVETVVGNKDAPPELYKAALQGYVYMQPDKALGLAKDMANKPTALNDTERSFIVDTMFVNNDNLVGLLPVLQQNPDKITDSMASHIAVMAAEPPILNRLNKEQKSLIIGVLKSHKLDPSNPMYQVELDTITVKVKEIEDTL